MEQPYENDIVFGRFINYMQKALLHRRINYIKKQDKLKERENIVKEILYADLYVDNDVQIDLKSFDNWENTNFKKSFKKLTDKQQKVLYFSYVEKMTNKNIAIKMEVSEKAIEQLKSRAIKKIKELMKGL